MRTLLIFLLLAFGAGVWGYTLTPEQIAQWKEAAENGNASAQFNLGQMYDNGEGVTEDDREAVKWYRMAAEQGEATMNRTAAQQSLGDAYDKGNGVNQNLIQAYVWYNMAAANGHEGAKKAKTALVEEMTNEQITKSPHPTRGPQAA